MTDYTNRCYDASADGFDGSSTITYDSKSDCTQTCISYSDLSAAGTTDGSTDETSSASMDETVDFGMACN